MGQEGSFSVKGDNSIISDHRGNVYNSTYCQKGVNNKVTNFIRDVKLLKVNQDQEKNLKTFF